MSQTPYNADFYDDQQEMSLQSARSAVPLLQELTGAPCSVLDVGCGVGTWLAEWRSTGIDDVLGVDGDYIDRGRLMIPAAAFLAKDLEQPLDLGRRFDLVMSLEVAEHIHPSAAQTFVESLTRHSDVVVFSAAIPGQGGTAHVNEQWPTYWAERFADCGYEPFDVVRSALWHDSNVQWWYAQNSFIYATKTAADRLNLARSDTLLDFAHPEMLARLAAQPSSALLRQAVKASPVWPLLQRLSNSILHR